LTRLFALLLHGTCCSTAPDKHSSLRLHVPLYSIFLTPVFTPSPLTLSSLEPVTSYRRYLAAIWQLRTRHASTYYSTHLAGNTVLLVMYVYISIAITVSCNRLPLHCLHQLESKGHRPLLTFLSSNNVEQ